MVHPRWNLGGTEAGGETAREGRVEVGWRGKEELRWTGLLGLVGR